MRLESCGKAMPLFETERGKYVIVPDEGRTVLALRCGAIDNVVVHEGVFVLGPLAPPQLPRFRLLRHMLESTPAFEIAEPVLVHSLALESIHCEFPDRPPAGALISHKGEMWFATGTSTFINATSGDPKHGLPHASNDPRTVWFSAWKVGCYQLGEFVELARFSA